MGMRLSSSLLFRRLGSVDGGVNPVDTRLQPRAVKFGCLLLNQLTLLRAAKLVPAASSKILDGHACGLFV